MSRSVKIRNINTRKEYNVTEREWETISSNPLVSYQYTLISKPVAEEAKPVESKVTKSNKS